MDTQLFALAEYCSIHHVEPSFVESLEEEGLILVVKKNENKFIGEEQLQRLEIFTRWYTDMGINAQGIDAMRHLLDRLESLHTEMNRLRHRLRFYEPGDE